MKNKILGKILLLAAALSCHDSYSANWFLRSASQGSANGTSWANAWSLTSLNANWASVSAGDTIWIAGGSYSGGISFTKSGSAGNYIYLKRATASDSAATGSTGWSAGFDSQVVIGPSGSSPLSWGSGGLGSYIYIDGRTTNGISCLYNNSANAFLGAAAWGGTGGQNNIVLTNLDLGGPGSASAFFYGGDNAPVNMRSSSPISFITLTHCSIHGGPNLIRSHPNGGNHHVLVEYCRFYDNASSNPAAHANLFYNEQGHDWTFRYNDFTGWQVEGIVLWDVGTGIYYIYGNIFHDPIPGVSSGFWPGSNASSNDPQGTVFLYNNTFVGVAITTGQSRSWQFGPGSVARNNIYWSSSWAGNSTISDTDYNFSNGSTPGAHSVSSGSNPFVNEAANNFNIVSTVSASFPRNKGVTLPTPFNSDLIGVLRGNDGAFDIGAFEYAAGAPSDPIISISTGSIALSAIKVGATTTTNFVIQNIGAGTLAGTASTSAPWSITGGANYSMPVGSNHVVTVVYTPTVQGQDSGTVTMTGGGGATVAMSGRAYTNQTGMFWWATNGLVTSPMTIASGMVIATANASGLPTDGYMLMGFSAPSNGLYYFNASVRATNTANDSFFFSIDSVPTDPQNIWDVLPTTSGTAFANRVVGKRGGGTFDSPESPTNIVYLTSGDHNLRFMYREINAAISNINMIAYITNSGTAPVFNSHPNNLRIIQGVGDTFTSWAVGTVPVEYQWWKDGSVMGGQVEEHLDIINAQTSNEGTYWVVASNSFGVVTSLTATVTVISPPTIAIQPTNMIAVIGRAATNFSSANLDDGTPTYYWQFDGVPIQQYSTNLILFECSGNDLGSYTMVVGTEAGSITSNPAYLSLYSGIRGSGLTLRAANAYDR